MTSTNMENGIEIGDNTVIKLDTEESSDCCNSNRPPTKYK